MRPARELYLQKLGSHRSLLMEMMLTQMVFKEFHTIKIATGLSKVFIGMYRALPQLQCVYSTTLCLPRVPLPFKGATRVCTVQ